MKDISVYDTVIIHPGGQDRHFKTKEKPMFGGDPRLSGGDPPVCGGDPSITGGEPGLTGGDPD